MARPINTFLRGFNLDHGTDLASSLMGVPLNMPTHVHGQGYMDLNFLMPELISGLRYKKGNYYAEEGDFSAAGAVHIDYVKSLEQGITSVELGQNNYRRALLENSTQWGRGVLLYGLEWSTQNGPWTLPEGTNKYNAVLRYSMDMEQGQSLSLTATAYHNRWSSTDQVPQRAIDSGAIGAYGNIDPTGGGTAARYKPAGQLRTPPRRRQAQGRGLRRQERTQPAQQLHLLPQRLPEHGRLQPRRPVHADREPQHIRRSGGADLDR
ncbi:MAG: hypothetical protein MO853_11900 [Candidatus Protistobacter heckmanni]|nr:hypothetical protein [Candidatus Protistobacter heckmanni]